MQIMENALDKDREECGRIAFKISDALHGEQLSFCTGALIMLLEIHIGRILNTTDDKIKAIDDICSAMKKNMLVNN